MKATVYARKVNTRAVDQQILSAAKCINNAAVLHKLTSSLVTQARKCIQPHESHFEKLV